MAPVPWPVSAKVHASTREAVDCAERRYFSQVHGAVRGKLPLGMGKVDQASGGLEPGLSGGEVQRLEVDCILGCFHTQIKFAADDRGLALLGGDIRTGNFTQIVVAGRGIGDHYAEVIGGKLERNGAFIDQRHAIMNYNPAGLKIEDRLDRRPTGVLLGLRRGLVGAAIGVNDEMDRRAVDL